MPLRKATDQSTLSSCVLAKDSALPHTTPCRPWSGSHVAQRSVTSVAEHEVSHFNLSEATTNDSQSPVRGKEPELRVRRGHRRDSRNRRGNPGSLRTRRDSVHAEPVSPSRSFSKWPAQGVSEAKRGGRTQSRDPHSLTNRVENRQLPCSQALTHSNFRYTLESQGEDDAIGGAESAQPRSRSKRDSNGSDFLDRTPAFDFTRPYSSSQSLGPLDIPRSFHTRKNSSPSRSIEVISDAGDQQGQHQEQQSVQNNDLDSEDSGLEASLASLPPLGPRYQLQTEILNARVRTRKLDGRDSRFVPKGSLHRVIHPASVAQELRNVMPALTADEVLRYSKAVCEQTQTREERHGKYQIRSYRKVFAILVLVEAASSIVSLLEEDISDQDLPLTLIERDGKSILCRRSDQEQVALRCFTTDAWSLAKLEKFEEYQWLLLAPFFSPDENGNVKHYILQDQHTLPFVAPVTAQGNEADRVGGYGKVLMVNIHRDHHNFSDLQLSQRGFAIKQQIDGEDREAFKQEASILRKFSGKNAHPHMVSLLATYEHCNKFHLVFYRADGDLLDFWRKHTLRPNMTHQNVTWMASQCAGLADGLSSLHKILTIEDPKPSAKNRSTADVFGEFLKLVHHPSNWLLIFLSPNSN
ncbi:hypothetical protein NX059_002865 [Plenodomus lindquistii]|nr:hypothetical protein NX059_002865 [Plenodomus lindquistii]